MDNPVEPHKVWGIVVLLKPGKSSLDLLHVRAVRAAVLAPVLALVRVVFPHAVEPLAGRDRPG